MDTADVRSTDFPCQIHLLLEAGQLERIARDVWTNRFQSDAAADFRIFGFVHLDHSSTPQKSHNSESVMEELTGRKRRIIAVRNRMGVPLLVSPECLFFSSLQ